MAMGLPSVSTLFDLGHLALSKGYKFPQALLSSSFSTVFRFFLLPQKSINSFSPSPFLP